MKVAVWDTYVKRADGEKMHFDIIVPEDMKNEEMIYTYGMEYLKEKNIKSAELTSKECKFCHIEKANDNMLADLNSAGYHIVEMENCNN
ncbi:DUF2024 family protein [Draconibacterium sp.]|uniref:DUF2024 family protein n=1 Tax=Draconibacterium sp. TaxID=1965318 RepID=UPI0025E9DE3A|nr:DUF2024 family protein [uncultured Draconibacterium sp.]